MKLRLFYMTGVRYGGFASYTAHLLRALQMQGVDAALFKVGKSHETRHRVFTHGVPYQNVSLDFLATCGRDVLITCAYWKFDPVGIALALANGASVVVHDPTELKPELVEALRMYQTRVIAIRKNNVGLFRDTYGLKHVVFVPHPYVTPKYKRPQRTKNAVAISRVDFDKHTDLIARANAMLPREKRCEIWGEANRMYVHHKLAKVAPEWEHDYRGSFPRTETAALELAASAKHVVDMSLIKGDGGGTQYTFMEAWDAEAQLVLQSGWLHPDGEMVGGENCIGVSSAEDLSSVLMEPPGKSLIAGGRATLADHAPGNVVPKLMEALA